MTELSETFVNPDAAKAGAGQLHAAGEDLAGKWTRLVGVINHLNDIKNPPWGTDEVGREFNKNYLKEGGKDAPANSVLDAGNTIVHRMAGLGADVMSAVKGTVELDELISKWYGGK